MMAAKKAVSGKRGVVQWGCQHHKTVQKDLEVVVDNFCKQASKLTLAVA